MLEILDHHAWYSISIMCFGCYNVCCQEEQ
jgi:hypothetical protein